jgi:tetratricopeptide (TPR) repeat protein
MSRTWVLLLAFAAVSAAQQAPEKKDTKPALKSATKPELQEQAPPEEDESLIPKEYSFNPLQASKEMRIGNYYFKRGKYRAASLRYQEATKWDNNNAESYLRLGEARDKLHDKKAAADAYAKYLELSPDAKDAAEVKKRLEKIQK